MNYWNNLPLSNSLRSSSAFVLISFDSRNSFCAICRPKSVNEFSSNRKMSSPIWIDGKSSMLDNIVNSPGNFSNQHQLSASNILEKDFCSLTFRFHFMCCLNLFEWQFNFQQIQQLTWTKRNEDKKNSIQQLIIVYLRQYCMRNNRTKNNFLVQVSSFKILYRVHRQLITFSYWVDRMALQLNLS